MKTLSETAHVRYIYHIADLHIRLFKRHDEYRQVFGRFFETLQAKPQNELSESIIVVVGDILHSKTELTPECVQLTQWFFTKLSSILPVFVVCGNHDMNLNNCSRLDSLTPILNGISETYYLNTTDHYRYGNVVFGVTTVKESKILKPLDLELSQVKVALFHGTVHKSVTDAGYRLTSKKFLVTDFDGYDLVMLGDIHRHQYLDDKKRIAYPSSLIQQNHGENLDGHGYIVWDLKNMTGMFVEVPNDYGYFTVQIADGKINPDQLSKISKKPRLRFEITNTDSLTANSLINNVVGRFNVQELISYNKVKQRTTSAAQSQTAMVIDSDKWFQKLVPSDQYDQVKALHNRYIADIPASQRPERHNWKILSLEFMNMFCYTNKVSLNFENYYGITGILGANHSGKSSLLDIILYCLFDKCSRGDRKEIINCNKTDFYCRLCFEINGTQYYVHRFGKKTQKTAKIDVEFWKIGSDGNKVSLSGTDRYGTNRKITEIIGTFDDLCLTSISLQNQSNSFIEMTQSNRKKILNDLLRLDFYEKLYERANSDLKSITTEIKVLTQTFQPEKIDQLNQTYQQYQEQLAAEQLIFSETQNTLADLQKQKENLLSKYHQINTSVSDFNQEEAQQLLVAINHKLETLVLPTDDEFDCLETKITEAEKQFGREQQDYHTRLATLKTAISGYQNQIVRTIQVYYTKESLLELKKKLETAAPHSYLSSEKLFLSDIHEKLGLFGQDEVLDQIKESVRSRLEQVSSSLMTQAPAQTQTPKMELADVISMLSKIEQNQQITENNERLRQLINENTVSLQQLQHQPPVDHSIPLKEQHSLLNSKIIRYNQLINEQKRITELLENSTQIEQNNQINNQIKYLQAQINGYNLKLKKLNSKITDLNSDLAVLRQKIGDTKNAVQKLQILNAKQTIMKSYLRTISKEGIPYLQLQEIVPFLEQKVNEILSLITEFTVEFKMDGKNIDVNITRTGQKFNILMASGFEKFICSLAIRVAMMNISLLPRPNFIAIDEGFGSFDAENLANISVVFDYLRNDFELILVISHIDLLKNEVEHVIIPEDLKVYQQTLQPQKEKEKIKITVQCIKKK